MEVCMAIGLLSTCLRIRLIRWVVEDMIMIVYNICYWWGGHIILFWLQKQLLETSHHFQLKKHGGQMIQLVTFWSPIVGCHVFTIPKRSRIESPFTWWIGPQKTYPKSQTSAGIWKTRETRGALLFSIFPYQNTHQVSMAYPWRHSIDECIRKVQVSCWSRSMGWKKNVWFVCQDVP